MRVPLDDVQMAQAQQWAADLGRPVDEIVAEAEEAKGGGYAQAHQAATETMAAMGGAGGQMYGGAGPVAELEAIEAEAG
jgi:hypothetical protein